MIGLFKQNLDHYHQLCARQKSGQLSPQQFQTEVRKLRWSDAAGAWWTIDPANGAYLRYDGTQWAPAQPAQAASPAKSSPAPSAAPQNLLEFFTILVKNFIHNLPRQILFYLLAMAAVWFINVYVVVYVNNGFNKGSQFSRNYTVEPNSIGPGSMFWFFFGMLVSLLISMLSGQRRRTLFAGLGSLPTYLRQSFQYCQSNAAVYILLVGAVGLGLAGLVENPLVRLTWLSFVIGTLLEQQRSLVATFLRLAWLDLQRLVRRRPLVPLNLSISGVLFSGLGLGLLASLPLPASAVWIAAAVMLVLAVALFFAQRGRRLPGATLFSFAIGLASLAAFTLLVKTALADDGGWSESGGTLQGWLNNPGSIPFLQTSLIPAIWTALGTMLGSALGGISAGGLESAPGSALIPSWMDPGLFGSPQNNPFTKFSGGNGPAKCSKVGLPNYWVNTANLNLYIEDVVYTRSGLGPKNTFSLSCNSIPGNRGMFGQNWHFSYESSIQQLPDRLLLCKGSGQQLSYRSLPAGAKQNPAAPQEAASLNGSRDRLFDYGSYFFLLEFESRLRYLYNKTPGSTSARLTAIYDQNDNAVTLGYTPDGSLQWVKDPGGRSTSFIYDASQRCIGFSLPDGRHTGYAYDGRGNLIQAVDLLGTTTIYEYDDENSLVRMIVGRDQKTTTFAYKNAGQGKYLERVTDASGNVTRYELVSETPRCVRVINPEGQATLYYSTPQGSTGQVIDPLGNTVVTRYTNGMPVVYTNANKQSASLEYDRHGNMLRLTDPLGAVWTSTYDNFDHLTSETDPLGATWQYAYDARSNLIHTVSPSGRTYALEYDPKGQVISIGDSLNNRVRFTYDAFGNTTSRTEATGGTTRIAYDPAGLRMIGLTDARGQSVSYEYDENDRVTRVINPDGTFRTYSYDCCAGISMVDENGNRTDNRLDPMLMLNEQRDAAGNATLLTYNRNYQLRTQVDALGHTTTFDYDSAGRRVRALNPLGKFIQTRYDPNGNLVGLTNEAGKTTTYQYDAANRLVQATDALGQSLTIRRDALGRPAEISGARGLKIGLSYNPDGEVVGKTYDGAGAASYEFDQVGNLVRLVDATGAQAFEYDPAGPVNLISYPDGTQVGFIYDEVRSLRSIVYPGSFRVDYTYDQRSRVAKVAWQDQWIAYQYSPAGDVVRELRSNGTESTYSYNHNGQTCELRHLRHGQPFIQISYARNSGGDIVAITGIQPVPAGPVENTLTTVYNELDQVQSRGQERYTYDADGNLATISGGSWQASYDPENRLVALNRSGKTATYIYNGLGQRVQATTGGAVHNYHSDLDGRLLFETDASGRVTRYYIYSGGLLAAACPADGQSLFYHFNQQGSTLAVTDAAGEISAAYTYTPFGLLAGQGGTLADNPFTFVGAYGVMDEGAGLYFMQYRYYDAATRRFIQKDPLGVSSGLDPYTSGVNPYSYASSNPLNRIDPLGLIDSTFSNRHFPGWKPSSESPGPGVLVGPLTATGQVSAGIFAIYMGVTGVMSGGSIPLATFGITVGGARIYATIKRVINGEYGTTYTAGEIPADAIDPTKGLRSGTSWLGGKWDDFNKWASDQTYILNRKCEQLLGVP